jgi:hypothetical protein
MRHRILVAAQPAAWVRLRHLLRDAGQLVPAHTRSDAFGILKDSASSIGLIACTAAFDDSRMIDFLQSVKREPGLRDIPFLCLRVLPSVLSDNLVKSFGAACREAGAADLIDLARLDDEAAEALLATAARACLHGGGRALSEPRNLRE